MAYHIKKPTGCVNIQQANIKKLHNHFNRITGRVKAEFIRMAVWVYIAWRA